MQNDSTAPRWFGPKREGGFIVQPTLSLCEEIGEPLPRRNDDNTCAVDGCDTILSSYDPERTTCYVHRNSPKNAENQVKRVVSMPTEEEKAVEIRKRKEKLAKLIPQTKPKPHDSFIAKLLWATREEFDIAWDDLLCLTLGTRKTFAAHARQVFVYVARQKNPHVSFEKLGEIFGQHAVNMNKAYAKVRSELRARNQEVEKTVESVSTRFDAIA